MSSSALPDQGITSPKEREEIKYNIMSLYGRVEFLLGSLDFHSAFLQLSMATVTSRCGLVQNAFPAGPLSLQGKFHVVKDINGEHMIFSIDN